MEKIIALIFIFGCYSLSADTLTGKIIYEDVDVCLEMIKSGMAWHYKKYQKEQSESDKIIYSDEEVKAQANKVGLFFDKDPTQPWEWRKK